MKVKEESGKVGLKLNIPKTKIMTSGSITSWQIEGEKVETVTNFVFLGSWITVDRDSSHEIKRCLLLRKQRHHFANKGPSSQSYGFSNSHIWIGELNHKESWALKSWCFWTVVLEKTLESPLDCKEINHSILKKSALNIHWKDWCWSWNSNTLASWCEELTHWKRPWCWER